MDFVRWGNDSDLHVFLCDDTLNFVCGECLLTEESDNAFHDDFETEYASEMIEHVKEHMNSGHQVPGFALNTLKEHQNKSGNTHVKEKKARARKAQYSY